MAFQARVSFTANGSTDTFSFSFSYISSSHVKAYVDGVEDTSITFPTTSSVTLASTPTSGAIVLIKRVTPIDSRLVDFQDGSVLSATDLDKSADQNFYAAQETSDEAQSHLGISDTTNQYDAGASGSNLRIINVLNPTSNQDAATKHYLENTWLSTSDKANLTTVAGISGNITTVAGISANVTSVAGDATDIGVVAGKATEIGLLGTSAVVTDLDLLATSAVITDLDLLATSANVTAMGLLGTSANVTAMGLLGNSDAIADMNTLATSDIISDLNQLATSDIVSDLITLATGANVTAMGLLGTAGNVTNMATVATNIAGVNSFADIPATVVMLALIPASVVKFVLSELDNQVFSK